jgi:hypothetical protein
MQGISYHLKLTNAVYDYSTMGEHFNYHKLSGMLIIHHCYFKINLGHLLLTKVVDEWSFGSVPACKLRASLH